jgi:hypothetical protein
MTTTEVTTSANPSTGRRAQARLSVNMGRATAEALHDLMESKGVTATEVVRRAISLLAFIESEREKGSRFALLTDTEKGQQVREVILGID